MVQFKEPNSQKKEGNGREQSAGDAENTKTCEAQLFNATYKQDEFHNR
jgi:hypothetical protein